jgi:hypothetical protein
MDGVLIGAGLMMLVTGIPAILRPDMMVRESLSNRNRRLEQLRGGAEEAYFEERRELEAYPPRFDFDHRTIRMMGAGSAVLGLVSLFQGIAQ